MKFIACFGGPNMPLHVWRRAKSWKDACMILPTIIQLANTLFGKPTAHKLLLPLRVLPEGASEAGFAKRFPPEVDGSQNASTSPKDWQPFVKVPVMMPVSTRYVAAIGDWLSEQDLAWKDIRRPLGCDEECLEAAASYLASIEKEAMDRLQNPQNRTVGYILNDGLANRMKRSKCPPIGSALFPREFVDRPLYSYN